LFEVLPAKERDCPAHAELRPLLALRLPNRAERSHRRETHGGLLSWADHSSTGVHVHYTRLRSRVAGSATRFAITWVIGHCGISTFPFSFHSVMYLNGDETTRCCARSRAHLLRRHPCRAADDRGKQCAVGCGLDRRARGYRHVEIRRHAWRVRLRRTRAC